MTGYTGNPVPPTTTPWIHNTATALNAEIVPNPPNGLYYKATSISGTGTTSNTTQPTWPLEVGQTVIDNPGANQVIWTCEGSTPNPVTVTLQEPVDGVDDVAAATVDSAFDSIADELAFLCAWLYVQEDHYTARGILASGLNIPAGATLPLIGGGQDFPSDYAGAFSPTIAAGSTYITSVGGSKPALDAYASESAGSFVFTPTGTALPTGATKIVRIHNNAGAGSNRAPEAVMLFPMNPYSAESLAGFGTGTPGTGNQGFYWVAETDGWSLWFQNGTGSTTSALGSGLWQFSYIAIY